MLDFTPISNQLSRWDQRRKQRDMLIWGPRGIMIGLYIGVAMAAIARFRPFLTNIEIAYWAAGLALAGLVIGVGYIFSQSHTQSEQARFADETFGLKERLVSAVELNTETIDAPPPMKERQLKDTLKVIEQVDTPKGIPFELNSQDWTLILLALVILLAAVILPNNMETILQGQRAVEQVVAEQIEALETLEEEIEANPDLTEEQRDALLDPLQNARQELEDGVSSREEALAALSQAESALRQIEEQNSSDALEAQMAQAGQSVSSQSGQELGEAMQAGDLNQTAEALENLSESVAGLSDTEQQALGQDLSQAASELSGTNPELAEQLSEAGSALQQGNVAEAEEALAQAGEVAQAEAADGELAEAAGEAAGELSQGRQEVTQAGEENPENSQAGETAEQTGEEGQNGEAGEGTEGDTAQAGTQAGEQPGDGSQAGATQPGAGSATGETSGAQAGGVGEGGGSTDNVFVPPFQDLSGEEGVEVELDANCTLGLENCGELVSTNPTEFGDETSIVPYEEVYSEYANTAYEALSEDYIPLGMKEYVRDYFSSLEPE